IARGWAGPSLLAMILFEKYGQHQPLNRQSERYAREGVPLSLSTLADQVGGCCAVLAPLLRRIEAHVFAAERLHGDDTTVPVLAKGKTDTGRCWVYVRDDRPFGGPGPPARRTVRDRRLDYRPERRGGPGCPAGVERTPNRRSGTLAARAAAQAVARQRSRQGDGLHAQTLAGVYTVPRRWSDLSEQQRRRARASWNCAWQKIMVVRGFRPRRTARRGDVQPDRHRQNERRRPASLAGGRPGPDRRASGAQDRRASTVELASALGSAQSGGLILAAIAAVFTIGYVANMLGEDEHW